MTEKASQTAANVKQQAQDAATNVKHQAQEVAGKVGETATQAGAQAAEKVDAAMTSAGRNMSTLAQTVRERTPNEGKVGEIASTAADALERGGRYLEQNNLDTMKVDLEGIMRRYPMQTIAAGLGLGFILARTMRR